MKYVENDGLGFVILCFVLVNLEVKLFKKWYIVWFLFNFEIGGIILNVFVVKKIIVFGCVVLDGIIILLMWLIG